MKKKKQTIYNDYDRNQVKAILKMRKAKKRKRRQRLFLVILFIVLVIAFFVSDYSRLKTITISGNNYIDKQEIVTASEISLHQDYTFFTSSEAIEKKIKTVPLIKSVKVTKDLLGNVKIKVAEAELIGQCIINNVLYVIDETGRVNKDELANLSSYVQRCPRLNGFDVEVLEKFSKQFAKIPDQVINQISDINYAPLNGDKNRCEFIMDDGKILYVRYDEMAQQLKGDNYSFIMEKFPNHKYYDLLGKYVYPSN